MKKLLIIVICSFSVSMVAGQTPTPTWNEIFRQKKTQRKYILQQIAALQVYIGALRKGYDIAKKGIATVNSIKSGEFSLHDVFYLSLKLVNPRIRSYPNLLATVDNLSFIHRKGRALVKTVERDNTWDHVQRNYIRDCIGRLEQDMNAVLDELTGIISDNRLSLTDDERLGRIDQLYQYTAERVIFIKSFSSAALELAAQRKSDMTELLFLRKQYGID